MTDKVRKLERKRAQVLLKETRKLQKRHGAQLEPEHRSELEEALQTLEQAINSHAPVATSAQDLEHLAGRLFAPFRKSIVREYVESIAIAVLIALVLRTFVVEPFKIPSGSMIPTLAIGDHIFVNKFSYGLWLPFVQKKWRLGSGPKRGDVIVFIYPKDPTKDFIKRVVGLPGDTIEVRNNTLFINKKKVTRARKKIHIYKERDEGNPQWYRRSGRVYMEDLFGVRHMILLDESNPGVSKDWSSRLDAPQLPTRSWGPKVKPGFVFVMGDNRDHSSDSREWGLVPISRIKGKAVLIWLSFGGGQGFQWKRIFTPIR